MTEAEAKTKWCPFARQMVTLSDYNSSPQQVAFGNRFNDDRVSFCLASACMAWRFNTTSPGGNIYLETGYCGLAGTP